MSWKIYISFNIAGMTETDFMTDSDSVRKLSANVIDSKSNQFINFLSWI